MTELTAAQLREFVGAPRFHPARLMARDPAWPRISVVMPSFNQAAFLEPAILSVLNQDYPNTELIILDGGSTDGSVDIIRRFQEYLAFWTSERDGGQAAALNRGLAMATGEVVGWLNSDDLYLPGAFVGFAEAMQRFPSADLFIADNLVIDERGSVLYRNRYLPFDVNYLIYVAWNLTSQATFWRHRLTKTVGRMREDLHVGFDWDWFIRLGRIARHPMQIAVPAGCYRLHGSAKYAAVPRETRWPIEAAILSANGIAARAAVPWEQQYRWAKRRAWWRWRIVGGLLHGERLRRWRHLWLPWWLRRGRVFVPGQGVK
jgi:glycosyltransferase involved in cell wall biosynthesis